MSEREEHREGLIRAALDWKAAFDHRESLDITTKHARLRTELTAQIAEAKQRVLAHAGALLATPDPGDNR